MSKIPATPAPDKPQNEDFCDCKYPERAECERLGFPQGCYFRVDTHRR